MSCQFRILDNILPFASSTTITATSEDASFPATNAAHPFRSKVWRSSGNFEITSANAKIDFADSAGGPELTATLTAGTYTPTSLAAHIVSKMALVGAHTYTVSQSSSTGKWTFTSSGTILELRCGTGTNIANGVWGTLGFAASNRTGTNTYTGTLVALHTAERLIFDMGSAVAVDSAALVFDPTIGSKLSASATVTLKANSSSSFTSAPLSQAMTFDSATETYTHFFSSDETYRYWAVEVVDPANSYLYVELSKVILANATTLDHGPEIGFKMDTDDLSKEAKTDYGHKYMDLYPIKRTFEFGIKLMPVADVYTLSDIFKRVGNNFPIAIATDPLEAVFDKDRFFIYGYLKGNLKIQNSFNTYFDTSLGIEEAM